MEIPIESTAHVEPVSLEVLSALVDELVAVVGRDSLRPLRNIAVVADEDVAEAVNAIGRGAGSAGKYSVNPACPATGVAVPVEVSGDLQATIVLTASLVSALSLDYSRPVEVVSTVLEELLHVRVYGATWMRRGHVGFGRAGRSACEVDLLTCVQQMCDEYVVVRSKAWIIARRPLIQAGPDEERVTAMLSYPGSLAESFRELQQRLLRTVRDASRGVMPVAQAWGAIVSDLYRSLLEPLARSAAYADASGGELALEEELVDDPFFRRVVALRVERLRDALRRVSESGLADTEVVLEELVVELTALLHEVGVTIEGTKTGESRVSFREAATLAG